MDQVKILKLTKGGNFRAWLVHVRALLTNGERWDQYLDREPADEAEQNVDQQARAKMVLCLANDMLPDVEGHETTHGALEALRASHIGHMQSMRSQIMADVTGMKQKHNQNVRDYVAVGRDAVVRLREVGMTDPATLVIPCFKNGIDARLRQQVLPLLNAERFDTDFELLAQEFMRITIGMSGAGAEGQAHTSRGMQNPRGRIKPRQPQHKRVEKRECYVCGVVGHLARNCPNKANTKDDHKDQGPQKGPLILMANGKGAESPSSSDATNISIDDSEEMLFDSGATHHIVNRPSFLRNMRTSEVTTITLGGGERHEVHGEGDVMVFSPETERKVLLTDVLFVPTISYNLCSGAQLTAKGAVCEQRGRGLIIKLASDEVVLYGARFDNLYYLSLLFVLPTEGQAHITSATWHRRLGHPPAPLMNSMVKHNTVKGLADLSEQSSVDCEACVAAKLERVPHQRSDSRAARPCELIHTDLICPSDDGLQTEGRSYVLTIMDDFSRYAEVAILSSKAEVAAAFQTIAARWERQSGKKIKAVRFDRGKEYYALMPWLKQQGIQAQAVPAYTPQANGRAERLNRTIIEKARTLLATFRLPLNLWQFAIQTAAHLRNVLPALGSMVTPYQDFFDVQPDVSNLRVFGCRAHVVIPNKHRYSKFAEVAESGMMVGYALNSSAWKILVSTDYGFAIRETQNVKFDEEKTDARTCQTLREFPDADLRQADGYRYAEFAAATIHGAAPAQVHAEIAPPTGSADASTSRSVTDILGGNDSENLPDPQNAAPGGASEGAVPPAPDDAVVPETISHAEVGDEVENNQSHVADESDNETIEHPYPRRAPKPVNRPYDAYLFTSDGVARKPPATYAQAKRSPEWPLWRAAMNRELQSLFEKQVYSDILLDDIPEDRDTIPTKWVFDYKTDINGAVIDHKARFVTKGFYQVEGVDYTETTAPTIQDSTLRMLLQYAAEMKLTIQQIDVKTAFLNGELIEEVYIVPPPGLPLEGRAWRLNKALYGLKQAARAWYEKWTTALLKIGMKPSDADPCLFIPQEGRVSKIMIGLYVDDALLMGTTDQCAQIVKSIAAEFEIKDLGMLKPYVPAKFLGMEIIRTSNPLGIVLKQEVYANKLIAKFLPGCKPVATPMTPGTLLEHEGELLKEGNEYAAIVGSLLYLSVKTRPDIAHALGVLSRFMSCPRVPHLKAAKNVLRYLAKDTAAGIFFPGRALTENRAATFSVAAYTDADFAADLVMRKSTSALMLTVNAAPIVWRSRLQSIVAQSTAEAEFVSAAMAVKEMLWMRKLFNLFRFPQKPIILYCDNAAALKLMSTDKMSVANRTKHIGVQYWLIVDHVMKGDIYPKFIPTADMLADSLTKPYSGPMTAANLTRIGMCTHFKD